VIRDYAELAYVGSLRSDGHEIRALTGKIYNASIRWRDVDNGERELSAEARARDFSRL